MSKAPIAGDPDRPPNPTPDKTRRDDSSRPLVAALRRLLEAAGPPALPFLRDWPRDLTARSFAARSLPVVSALDGLERFAAPKTRALVQAVAARARDLDWRQTYQAPISASAFSRTTALANGAGERGAFESDAIACGVLLLGPDIEYPAHSHEAEELYLPLAGHAWWRSAQSDWRLRAPGTWIHHPSWTTHAMRTHAEPLLAAYVWRAGDLTAKSRIDG